MEDIKLLSDKLKLIQDAYRKREVKTVDQFIAVLFDPKDSVTIVGTSDNEICFDLETIKQLFVSDWKYWGDLELNTNEAIIRIHNDTSWVHLPGTVRYLFSDNDETYRKFIDFIEMFFDGKSYDSKKTTKIKFSEINWLLAHLLHQREPKLNRDYLMKLRLFLIFTKSSSEWKARHIQFSVPKLSPFADQRFSNFTPYEKSYRNETDKYEKQSNYASLDDAFKDFLQDFQDTLFSKEKLMISELDRFFTGDSCLLTTGKELIEGKSSIIRKLISFKSNWDRITLNIKTGVYANNEDSLWFHTNGIMSKRIKDDELYLYTESDVKKILNSTKPDKEKLFLIRKSIATTFYEQSFGEEYVYPYRFDAFLTNSNGEYWFDYIQFSYPFNTILEQINDGC